MEKIWSDATILKKFKNPNIERPYTIKMTTDEITMIGVKNQPDFASIEIDMIPSVYVIELKSLKFYFFQFRSKLISYERFINVIYDDIDKTYNPHDLKITMIFKPRGGITSTLIIGPKVLK